MFGIGLPELIVILGIALIVVGPEKLPDLAKSLARGVLELKKTALALKDSLNEELKEEGGQDPWQQKPGREYPALPSTTVIDPEEGKETPTSPEEERMVVDAVSPAAGGTEEDAQAGGASGEEKQPEPPGA